jgi:O-antigen ligase
VFDALRVYVAALPILWPPLGEVGRKVVVVGDLAFLAVVAALALTAKSRTRRLRVDALAFAALPVVAIGAAAVADGNLAAAAPDLLRVSFSMVVFLVLAHVGTSVEETAQLARVWVATAATISTVGLIVFFGVTLLGWPQNPLAHANSPNLGRTFVRVSPALETNAFVLYLQMSIAIALFLLVRHPGSPRERRLVRSAVVLFLFTSLFAFSRGLIGLGLSVALLAPYTAHAFPAIWRARNGIAAIVVVLALFGAFATIWAVFPLAAGSGHERRELRPVLNMRRNAYNVLHAAALRMFLAHPVFGVGPGRFGRSLYAHTSPQERESAWPPLLDNVDYDPHSTWLGWAAEGGLVVLGAWTALYAWLLARLVGRRRQPLTLRQAIGLALVGIIANGVHVEITHLKFVWAAIGLALGTPREAVEPHAG